MNIIAENINYRTNIKLQNRLTALWAFSESALGGLLHLMKFPFRGMILASNAAVLVSLISYFSSNKRKLLETTMLVILVKFIISPYTPLTAYLAVSFQGVTGFLLYRFLKAPKVCALFHSVFAQLQSSLQKFIGLTIFFGMTFWYSLDVYIDYIVEKFGVLQNNGSNVSYSFIFVVFYVFLHVVVGLVMGIIAGKAPDKVEKKLSQNVLTNNLAMDFENINRTARNTKKRKYWWQRKSGIILLTVFVIMALMPFVDPDLEKGVTANVIYMVVRSLIITFIWFVIISPLVVKYVQKYLKGKESIYINELNDILKLVPVMRKVVKERWNVRQKKKITKLPAFFSDLFYTLLLFTREDINDAENK